jgi:hypothetical protein
MATLAKFVETLCKMGEENLGAALREYTAIHAHEYAWPASEKKLALAKLEVWLASLNERGLTRQARADKRLATLRKRKAA